MNAPYNVAVLSAFMKHVQNKGFGCDAQTIATFPLFGIGDVTTVMNFFQPSQEDFVKGVVQVITQLQSQAEVQLESAGFVFLKSKPQNTPEEMESRLEIILPQKGEYPPGFPVTRFESIIIGREYNVMFEADARTLQLGNFFQRRSPLSEELESLISLKQDDMPFNTLGFIIWDTILKHGGVKTLSEIFQETIEMDMFSDFLS